MPAPAPRAALARLSSCARVKRVCTVAERLDHLARRKLARRARLVGVAQLGGRAGACKRLCARALPPGRADRGRVRIIGHHAPHVRRRAPAPPSARVRGRSERDRERRDYRARAEPARRYAHAFARVGFDGWRSANAPDGAKRRRGRARHERGRAHDYYARPLHHLKTLRLVN